jgi:hypothetical protein
MSAGRVIWYFLVLLEAVSIDRIRHRNVLEGLAKTNINRKRKAEISGYTHFTVIAHRMAIELGIHV